MEKVLRCDWEHVPLLKQKLDFGSGHNPRDGYQTCDITQSPYLDYAFDTESYRISCDDHVFDEVYLRNVIHHVADLPRLFAELQRVLKRGGHLVIEDCRRDHYRTNIILDVVWYRYIIPRYEVWFAPVYRDYISMARKHFHLLSVVNTEDGIRNIATFKKPDRRILCSR